MINWNEPKFGKEEIKLVTEVLKSGYVSEGPKTKELETKLARIVKTKHVIMTTSCTAALYLAIEAYKRINNYKYKVVVMPDLTFVATRSAVEMVGWTPLFIDVDKKRFLLDITKSLNEDYLFIPVNLFGRNADYYGKNVICDNAGCLGSKVSNGKVGCYSLQGNKIISCGQGGFCATDDDKYAEEIRKIKDFGRSDKDDNDTIGFNLKFNDILAGIALGQLTSLVERKKLLLKQYSIYRSKLKKYGHFIMYQYGEVPLWVEFITDKRDLLFDYLNEKEIHCRKPWKAITGLVNSKYYSDNCLWLPNGPGVSIQDINKVIKEIIKFNGDKKNT